MSEKEFKSYRFNDRTDPTDEHLAELMRQAAEDTREKVNGLRMLSISIPITLHGKSLGIGILLNLVNGPNTAMESFNPDFYRAFRVK